MKNLIKKYEKMSEVEILQLKNDNYIVIDKSDNTVLTKNCNKEELLDWMLDGIVYDEQGGLTKEEKQIKNMIEEKQIEIC